MARRFPLVLLLASACIPYVPRPLDPQTNAAALQQRRLDDPNVRAFAEQSLKRQFDRWPPESWNLDTLTAVALYFNPDIAVARAEQATAAAAIATARERPNPTLTASPQHKPSDPQLSPWVSNFGFDFPLELPAKRRERIAQATELAAASQARIGAIAWGVRSRLRARMLDLFAARQREAALDREESIENDIVELFSKRLELGESAQPELSRARVALYQTTLLRADARRLAAEARAGVAAAAGVPEPALGNITAVFDHAIPAIDATLRDQALIGRADVLAALHEYAAADAALRLEVARQVPDIHLQPAFGWDQGTRTWTLGAAAELPLMNRHRGPIGEASARREEMAARFNAVQAGVIAQWDAATASLAAARAKLDAADTVVRTADAQAASVRKQFDAGEIDRLALRSSELEAEAAHLARADALIELQQAAGAVEDALQRPIAEESR